MKYLVLSLFLCLSVNSFAQEEIPHEMKRKAEKFTPEQRASLKTKKLTLALNLNESQQRKVEKLQLEQALERAEFREARKAAKAEEERSSRTSEDRYALLTDKMDRQIAYQREMQSILSDEQFTKWKSMNEKKGPHRHRRHGKKSREHHRHHRAH